MRSDFQHATSRTDPVMLVGQVHFRDAAREVAVQERFALVVGKGGTPPVIAETLLEEFVDRFGFQTSKI